MSITANFLKLRSTDKPPKIDEWNINYDDALALAKKEGKFIVANWSNGDLCGNCTNTETCMMDPVFTDWMAQQDAYFVFQYSGDPDKGQEVHDWCYKGTGLRAYPGYRVTLYDKTTGEMVVDECVDGNKLRKNKLKTEGAKNMIAGLDAIFAEKPEDFDSDSSSVPEPEPEEDYKIRLNEAITTKQVNSVLDALDAKGGYCPCQPVSPGTKCHCEDFRYNKQIGEPCICNIYVKQPKG